MYANKNNKTVIVLPYALINFLVSYIYIEKWFTVNLKLKSVILSINNIFI